MPVRLRITLLFALVVFIILGIVCTAVYYFTYTSRLANVRTQLKNRAMTTGRLLRQSEMFNQQMIHRIDSLTTLTLKNETVQVYDDQNREIYRYTDLPGDTLQIDKKILDEARRSETVYFDISDKEAIAYHHADANMRIVIVAAAEDKFAKQRLSRLKRILFFSFWGGVVIALGGGYFFSKSLLRPIKKITAEVTDISAHNLTRRIHESKVNDEWHRLAHTLNQLLDRLQDSFDMQRRFIANASHELSTPLTSISSQLEVSLQRNRSAGEYRRVMRSVLQDAQQLGKLTQTLLELAKASDNAGGIQLEPVRIDEILMQMPTEMQKEGNAQHCVSLRFENLPEDEQKLLVYGNGDLLFTAIKNVVSNACKYSPDHRADIVFRAGDEGLTIAVKDNGNGIPQKERERIYQPFYRVEESRTTPGFGLGLPLAYRIIKLHGGKIETASETGYGSTFTIQLPVADKSLSF